MHVEATHELDGSPDFPIPMPSNRHILAVIAKTRIAANYRARRVGTTDLEVTTPFCVLPHHKTKQRPATCPALVVTVKP